LHSWHDIFYFPKILEQPRRIWENPHVQITSKFLCRNPQSLAKFQIQLKFEINFPFEIFLGSSPSLPAPARSSPQAATSPLGPAGLRHLGVFAKRRLLFGFVHSGSYAFSLSCRYHAGPTHQLFLLLPSAPLSRPCRCGFPLDHPRRPAWSLEMLDQGSNSPAIPPPPP
jgi:hypothetical protein